MNTHALDDLLQLKRLAYRISPTVYIKKLEILSGLSIGDTFYHIIERYQQLISGISPHVINYTTSEQKSEIAQLPQAAAEAVDTILSVLNSINLNQEIAFETDMFDEVTNHQLHSSVGRELAYCIEHTSHHFDSIKLALKDLGKERLIEESSQAHSYSKKEAQNSMQG